MNIRFLHLMLVAALVALLPTSANAFMRYGGGGAMHYGGGGGMHPMPPQMHSMPQGYPMQSHGMPSGEYGRRMMGPPRGEFPHGETILRHGPPIERFGGIVRERGFRGGGVVIERGGYGGGGVGVERGGYSVGGGAVLGGSYGYTRFHHHESGAREFVEQHRYRSGTVQGGCDCGCCCNTDAGGVDPPVVVERGLTPADEELLESSYK